MLEFLNDHLTIEDVELIKFQSLVEIDLRLEDFRLGTFLLFAPGLLLFPFLQLLPYKYFFLQVLASLVRLIGTIGHKLTSLKKQER